MEGRLSSYTKHVLKSTVLNCSISQQHLQCCPFSGKVVRKSDERWQRSLLGWAQSSRDKGRVHWLGLQRPGWRNKRVKWGKLSNAVHYQEDGIGGGSGEQYQENGTGGGGSRSGEQYQENGTGGGGSRSGDSVEDGDGSSQNGVSVGIKVGKYAASTAMAVKDSLPPEGVIVLLSCLVGLLTGGSVVLFNLVVRCTPCPFSPIPHAAHSCLFVAKRKRRRRRRAQGRRGWIGSLCTWVDNSFLCLQVIHFLGFLHRISEHGDGKAGAWGS
jgi:hypothetical protein